jgi:excisionase family DNA binding protein
MSPSRALATIEGQVPVMTVADCLEALAATARLNAVLAARNMALAAQETSRVFPSASPVANLLDAKGAARRLGLSLPTIYRLARSGELPAVRVGNDLLRFAASDIDGFIQSHRRLCPR